MRRAIGQNHLRGKKSGNKIRQKRKWVEVSEIEAKKLKKLLPGL